MAVAAQPTTPRLGPIGQLALAVPDVVAAVRFYRDDLGLPLLFEAPPGLAFFDAHGVRLMLSGPQSGDVVAPSTGAIYFRVDDIHGAHDALAARGVAFERGPHMVARMPDHELWMAFMRDPGGNLLALMAEVRP
jgi:methylmalonyl-CoA/ethylmalonyl-CoA epimerase